MQPIYVGGRGADGQKQSRQPRQRQDALPRVTAIHDLLEKRGVDPVEQGDVQDQLPVLVGEALAEPAVDPAVDDVTCRAGFGGAAAVGFVATDAQRDGPAGRFGGDPGQLAAGQFKIEKASDVRGGETEILSGQNLAAAKNRSGGIEPRR